MTRPNALFDLALVFAVRDGFQRPGEILETLEKRGVRFPRGRTPDVKAKDVTNGLLRLRDAGRVERCSEGWRYVK